MLLYHNRSFWRMILEHKGSVFFRRNTLLIGFILALISAGVQLMIDLNNVYAPELPHHYGMHALGVIVTFAVVFRTNLGWQRYWEAMTQLHFMYSKWADAYSQYHAFCQVTIEQSMANPSEANLAKIDRLENILTTVENNFSLLSALASDRLCHGDTQRMEKRAEVASWGNQVVMRRELRVGADITGARTLPRFTRVRDSNFPDLGTCVSMGLTPDPERVKSQDLEGTWKSAYVVLKQPSKFELQQLETASDRTNMVMYWIIHNLARTQKDLDIAPPIQSRMYQELSNGMLGFNNALKIADVPFPFPYAQLLTLLLVVYTVFIPIYIVCFTKSMIAGPILTFLLFEGIWGVNEVAKELENPFGSDVNDISVADFHGRFMDVLEDVRLAFATKVQQEEDNRLQAGEGLSDYHNDRVSKIPSAMDQLGRSSAFGANLRTSSQSSVPGKTPPPGAPPYMSDASLGASAAESSPYSPRVAPESTGDGRSTLTPIAEQVRIPPPVSPQHPSETMSPGNVNGRNEKELQQKGAPINIVDTLDQHLKQIGTRMELHVAQIAKELTVISSLNLKIDSQGGTTCYFVANDGKESQAQAGKNYRGVAAI